MKRISLALSILMVLSMLLSACGAGGTSTTPTAAGGGLAPTSAVAPTQAVVPTEAAAPTQAITATQATAPTEAPTTAAQQPTTAPTQAAAPTTAPSGGAANVTGSIRVGSWDSGDALVPFNDAIKSFEAKYPGVKVQLESVPQGYGDKLLTQFAGGTAPDVFQVGDGDVAKFAGQGALEDLGPYISGEKGNNPLDMSVFFPAVADIGKVNGKTYLLTKDYSPLVIYYNKDLFDAAGVPYPKENWTWDDFVSTAQKLTQKDDKGNVKVWGVQLPNSWGDYLWYRGISPIVYSNGGNIIGPDGKTSTGYMNSPETVDAIQKYVDLFLKDKVAPTKADVDAMAGVDLFQNNLTAMLWTGRWPLQDFEKNPKLKFGTVGLPVLKEHANSICWAGFAMYSKGKNKDAAWAFLRYIGAGQGAEEFAKYAFTAVQSIAEKQGLSTDQYNAPIIKDLQYIRPLPELTNQKFGECAETNFKNELEKVFLQGEAVQAAMDNAAKLADACFAKP